MLRRTHAVNRQAPIVEALPGLMFRVKVQGVEDVILAHLAGKMKINNIRVLAGDRVLIELSPDGRQVLTGAGSYDAIV